VGLGPLLQRMPAGLFQMVGERGWQLPHGERSRVSLALLQYGALLILDESFASLDPEDLDLATGCVFNRAQTLAVIAHP
jgi:ATP-binding cassette, subfamily B, bacterial